MLAVAMKVFEAEMQDNQVEQKEKNLVERMNLFWVEKDTTILLIIRILNSFFFRFVENILWEVVCNQNMEK